MRLVAGVPEVEGLDAPSGAGQVLQAGVWRAGGEGRLRFSNTYVLVVKNKKNSLQL